MIIIRPVCTGCINPMIINKSILLCVCYVFVFVFGRTKMFLSFVILQQCRLSYSRGTSKHNQVLQRIQHKLIKIQQYGGCGSWIWSYCSKIVYLINSYSRGKETSIAFPSLTGNPKQVNNKSITFGRRRVCSWTFLYCSNIAYLLHSYNRGKETSTHFQVLRRIQHKLIKNQFSFPKLLSSLSLVSADHFQRKR